MAIKPKRKLLSSSAKSPEQQDALRLRRLVTVYQSSAEQARELGNETNRHKTKVKQAIREILEKRGANENDGIVVGEELISFRPNISEEISPREWHQWFLDGKISENQYFKAISVSVTDARNAIGEDQIPELIYGTLTKTADLRILAKPAKANDGETVPFVAPKVKSSDELRLRKTEDSVDKTATKPPVKKGLRFRRKITA